MDNYSPCKQCGKPVELLNSQMRHQAKRSGICHKGACCDEFRRRISSETMARTNRKYASQRMKERNPMRRPEVRLKVSATLQAMGHRPIVRGGNGRGPTVPERMMAEALGWTINLIVPTRVPRGCGIPTHFKIDVGNPLMKIAVEIDGTSHNATSRKQQDQRKTQWLSNNGWTVIRFKNEEIIGELSRCVSAVRELLKTQDKNESSGLSAGCS